MCCPRVVDLDSSKALTNSIVPCPNGILIKEEIKFDNNHSLVHLRVTKQITNEQVAINSLKSKKKKSNDYYYVT